ncbi:MAG: IS110 family transposase [bacterium]
MFVGIDWGRNAHTIALLKDNGEIMKIFEIRNDYDGYIDLLKHLQSGGRVAFAVENRTHRLVNFLIAHGYSGFYVNPNAMPSYRSRYKSAPVKSDELDAFILADLLRTDRHNLAEIISDTPFVRELKGLIIDRERYVRDETRLVNRLEGCLVEYYPEGLKVF